MKRRASRPPLLPGDLPEGKTIADLSDHEIRDRAEVVARVLELLKGEVVKFVAAGCPSSGDSEFLEHISAGLSYFASAFRGARVWRESSEQAVRLALANDALRGEPKDLPPTVLAAFWCDVALQAEEAFWASIRENDRVLPRLEELSRMRVH